MTHASRAPIAVYVHVPYCRRICPYCDFNVHPLGRAQEHDDVSALVSEMTGQAAALGWTGRTVDSVSFGGGTPSLVSAAGIARILEAVAGVFALPAGAEITLEANPGTIDEPYLRALRSVGLTRLSLGVQTFDDALLDRLGRDHSAGEARAAVETARRAGCENVSLDLIYGIPGQTLAMLAHDVDEVQRLAPEHVSAYELTYEPGTAFTKRRDAGRLVPLGDDDVADMDALLADRLPLAGWRRYEVSSWARPGAASRHNQRYWDGSSYLGVGPGAHSFAAEPLPGRRWSNVRDPGTYRAAALTGRSVVAAEDAMSPGRARSDFIVTGLRRVAGVDGIAFRDRFGLTPAAAFPALATLESDGLVVRTPTGLRLTPLGMRFADTVNAAIV